MAENNEHEQMSASAGPIRITIEIDRPEIGLAGARDQLRAAIRDAMLSLREVLDAGIDTLETENRSADTPEKITIE